MNSALLMLASNLLWLVAAQQPLYSPPPAFTSVAPVDTGVSVSVYDVGRHFAFAHLFDSPDEGRMVRYSIVLTNESTRHIVGVAVRWIVTDYDGQNRTTTWSFDSFTTNQVVPMPVFPIGTQLIATPGGFAIGRPDHVSSLGGRGQMLMRIDDFDRAQRVTTIVDTIIFEDGRVIGTDESHLVDYINAIAGATKALVKNVRDAMSEGRDVDTLRNIVAMKRTRSVADLQADPAAAWTMREATFLLLFSLEQRMQRLRALEQVPPPPTFYR